MAELGVAAGGRVTGGGGGGGAKVGAEEGGELLRVAGPMVGKAQGSEGRSEAKGVIFRRNLRFLWVGARLPCMRTM